MTVAPILPTETALEVESYETAASMLVVSDAATYTEAAEWLLGIKALRAKIAEFFAPHIQRAYESHRALTAARSEQDAPLAEAERVIKAKLGAFAAEAERRRLAEVARLRAEQEAAERKRRDEEAEALRQAAIDQAAAGDTEAAAELVQTAEATVAAPVMVATPDVAPAVPKVAGLGLSKPWANPVVEVFDLDALVRHCLEHPDHAAMVIHTPNLSLLKSTAKQLKEKFSVPGVRVSPGTGVSAAPGRGKR
jgi:DNA primase